ncbi:hypothetical protein [Vineibacter terrae]|uniref:hypothetical protein n=1 Tax=Vineibacter terrae TaxID=2586908 RepID=UPI0015B72064|nr:hypothetical protein [Vineibacter terrae]
MTRLGVLALAAWLSAAMMPWPPAAQAQTAPDLECAWKGTCPSRPAPRPQPPPQARPQPPPPAPPRPTPPSPPPGPVTGKDIPGNTGPGPATGPGTGPTPPGPVATPPATPPGPPPVPVAVVTRLHELADGDPQDVLLFFNETPDAPNGTRSPQGQVSFRDGRVAPCAALGWTGGPEVSAAVRAVLERHGATRVVTDVATPCPESRRPFDIVAVERRLFQALPPEILRGLVTDIVERRLTPLTTVTAADIATARQHLQRERDVTAGLRDGTLQGMGLLLLGGSSARRICAAGVDDELQPAVAAAIQGWSANLPPHLAAGGPDVAAFDRNGALAAAQRGECGAIFGDAATLRDIEAALRRDGQPVTPAGVWLTPPEWQALLQRTGVPRTTAERRRVLAAKVNPLAERLVADLQRYIADGGTGPAGADFTAFAQWHAQLKSASWALAAQRYEIDDYGDAAWSGGSLPAASVIVYFSLTAAGKPAPETNCMIFAWLDDAAAGARREPAAFRCDALSDVERWKRQRALKSRWS